MNEATTKIRFTQPYAGWARGGLHTVRLDVALALERLQVAEILESPAPAAPPPPVPAPAAPFDDEEAAGPRASDLETIDGIGPARALAIQEAGIFTVADLAQADPDELDANLDGSSKRQIRQWIQTARRMERPRP